MKTTQRSEGLHFSDESANLVEFFREEYVSEKNPTLKLDV